MNDRQIARLQRLQELKASGALSPEEFERAKGKLLMQPSATWMIATFFGACVLVAIAAAIGLSAGREATSVRGLAPAPKASRTSPTPLTASPAPMPTPAPTPSASPSPSYPRYVSSIPRAFRGRWDEIVADRCEGREARFMMTANKFWNFEVETDVTRVTLLSPTDIDIDVSGYDENMNQASDTWMLRLAEGGKALTGRSGKPTYFRRCPS